MSLSSAAGPPTISRPASMPLVRPGAVAFLNISTSSRIRSCLALSRSPVATYALTAAATTNTPAAQSTIFPFLVRKKLNAL